ncbi:hypothetical protein DV735_g832, partial [Chaetothyriales sp. CBS 134920]
MGRQADLTRLALGRSPFGDLLRDEQGNVIVGKHSQDNVARGYIQAFDDKGRPTNAESEKATRRLIRAQNEVLRVAGVVRKKGEGPDANVNDQADKLKLLDTECDIGASLGYFTEVLGQISEWWLKSWRSRVLVFRSRLESPILTTLASERRTQGLLPFLFAGLPSTVCAACLNSFRHWTLFASPHFRRLLLNPRTRYENHETTLPALAHRHLVDLLFFSFEWPLRAFAILQSLANVIEQIMTGDATGILIALLTNPFILAYIGDLTRESLSSGFHAVLSNCLPQPIEPDPWSLEVMKRYCGDEEPSYGRDRLIGVRLGVDLRYSRDIDNPTFYHFQRQYRGPQTVLPALRAAFPAFFWPLQRWVQPWIEYHQLVGTEDCLAGTRMLCCRIYADLKRMYQHMPEVDDQQIREEASLQAFDRLGLDLIELGIDLDGWTSSLTLPDYATMTPTPETLSAIEGMSDVAGPVQSTNAYSAEEDLNNTEQNDTEQNDTDQNDTDQNDTEQNDTEQNDTDQNNTEQNNIEQNNTMEQGEEGLNNTDEQSAATETLDPAEQPTAEIADEGPEERAGSAGGPDMRLSPAVVSELAAVTAADASSMQALLESRDQGAPADLGQDASSPTARLPSGVHARGRAPELDDREYIEEIARVLRVSLYPTQIALNLTGTEIYRVTHLSLTSKEVLSMFTSNILTSILMLPLDIYLSRLVVRGFALSLPASRAAAILRDVWPASPWAAAREMGIRGNLVFFSRVFWSFGLQGIMTATMTTALAAVVRWIGHRGFEWRTVPKWRGV